MDILNTSLICAGLTVLCAFAGVGLMRLAKRSAQQESNQAVLEIVRRIEHSFVQGGIWGTVGIVGVGALLADPSVLPDWINAIQKPISLMLWLPPMSLAAMLGLVALRSSSR